MPQNWTGKLGLILCIYPNNAQHHEGLDPYSQVFYNNIFSHILLDSLKILFRSRTSNLLFISPDLAVVKLMLYLICSWVGPQVHFLNHLEPVRVEKLLAIGILYPFPSVMLIDLNYDCEQGSDLENVFKGA